MGSAGPIPRKWILVVDDDARVRDVWIETLETAGYAAVGSEDGLAAADLIRDLFPDLIILDLRMPRMSGWDFLEIMRSHPRWQRIPVLIVSGYLGDDRPIPVENLNIVGRLAKPVTVTTLLQHVQQALGPGRSAPRRAETR